LQRRPVEIKEDPRMDARRMIAMAFALLALLLLAAGIRLAQSPVVAAAEPRIPPPFPAAQPQAAASTNSAARAGVATQAAQPTYTASSGDVGPRITQSFALHTGWNTIFLEVEPDNTSPLVDPDGAGPLPPQPSLSTIEAVFAGLSCTDCLESVWTWHTPRSRMDYIVDPAEGLWDAPGWDRYFPETNVGDDGNSRQFLTTLLNLHANTGYLVKLRDSFSGTAALQVTGRPVVGQRRWAKASYNLVGFPLLTGAEPNVALLKSTSAISDVLKLGTDGRWERLADGTGLQSGQAYLAYYRETTAEDYTAPLTVRDVASDGLRFRRGGASQAVRVENLSAVTVTVAAALVDAANSGVALRYVVSATETVDLRTNSPVTVAVGPGGAKVLEFLVAARDQRAAGTGLLQISAAALGTRWLIPLTTATGSYAGLWVGDVVVNDVSESRLGATNVAGGLLTFVLTPRNKSGISGAVALHEIVAGGASSVALTTTLALTGTTSTTELQPPTSTTPYLAGYVYADVNQNGQRDAAETGFAGVVVRLTRSGASLTATTDATGAYLFQGVAAGTYDLALTTAPTGYTAAFTVTPPVTQTLPITATVYTMANAVPASVTLTAEGVSDIGPAAYKRMALPAPYTLPSYSATGERIEPLLNFGFVPAYDVSLWTGLCTDRLVKQRDLGQAVNGKLTATLASAALNPPPAPVTHQLLGGGAQYLIYVEQMGGGGAAAKGIACGEIAVGAPTKLADGRGSEFSFRVLLRVAENGAASLLPDYVFTETRRISSVAFSHPRPITATAQFAAGQPLSFPITIAANDPLNPFLHKYHPDHDNLDTKFNPLELNSTPSYLWESPEVRRRITLELSDVLPYANATADEAIALDWGGANWGGYYREVIQGLHKNAVTVKGYFVIRQVLTGDQLAAQAYDRP
jgi:hypothetical protein